MRIKFWIFILVLALAILAATLRRQSGKERTVPTLPQQTIINNAPDAVPPASNTNVASQKTNVVTPAFAPGDVNIPAQQTQIGLSPQPQLQSTNSRWERLTDALESKNATVSFYGHVIDQDSNSVPEARVVMRVRQWHLDATADPWGNKFPRFERITDSDGKFSLEGTTGDSLSIESVSKDGYRLSPKAPNIFGYGSVPVPFYPDPQNPIIIKMWKLGGSQQLVSHHLSRVGLPVDGSPVNFDLFNGTKAAGGQLITRLKRDPQILPPHGPRYDWNLQLEIPNGGLVVNTDEFMYLAPNSGYQKVFHFNMPKGADNWTAALDQQFYIQFENGKYYGSLVVHLSTIHDTPPLGLNLDIVINSSGSRSLQP